jgi:hypothetical protein
MYAYCKNSSRIHIIGKFTPYNLISIYVAVYSIDFYINNINGL